MSLLTRASAAPSHAQLGALLDSADEALVMVDGRQRVTYSNHAATRLLGCEIGQGIEVALPRVAEPTRGGLCQALADSSASTWQRDGLLTDGRPVHLAVFAGPGGMRLLRAHASRPEPILPRLDARATSEVVRLLWDAPQPLLVQDVRFIAVAANRAFLSALGMSAAQVLGHDPIEFVPAQDRAEFLAARPASGQATADGQASVPVQERRLRDAQGRDRWFRFTPRWVSADDGSPLMLSILLDVTPEHQARAQVDRSVHELEHWFDLSPVGMLVYDQTGLVLRSNATFESLVGRTPVMLSEAAADLRRLLAWEGSAVHPDLVADAPALEVHATVRAPDGRSPHLRARLRAFRTEDGQQRVMAIVEDRSLEDERDLAELEIGALMDTAGVGVATYEASRGWLPSRGGGIGKGASGSPAGPLSGLPSGPNLGLQSIRREQVEKKSMAEYERLQRALRQGEQVQVRYEVRLPELGRRWLLTRVEPGELAGGRATLSVVTLDITEQEALGRERELMFNMSDVGISYVRDGHIERANDALARLTGVPATGLVGLPLAALFDSPQSHARLWAEQDAALQRDGHWRGERQLKRHDGSAIWVQVTKRRVDTGDPQAGLICSYVDIDERRNAREALQLQAERTRAVLDSVLVGIVTVGDTGIEWMNRSARRMFGGELADFVGAPISAVATDEADHPLRATHYRQSLADGQAETFECRLRARDGREFWVVGNAVVTGREGDSSQITFALLDIERRRQAEISIAQAQASLQRIIDTAPLAIALFDAASLRVLRLNTMAAQFFGQQVDAVLGRTPEECFTADQAQALREDLRQALAGGEVLRREQQRPVINAAATAAAGASTDGPAAALASARIWDTRIVSIGSAGEPQLLLVASDVTEQRMAEQERFEAAVSQREMLVKEVHHRIKNNLQGVAGLLQQTAVRRPEVATLINEVVGQVQAIAQVHGLQVGVSGPLRVRPLLEAVTASVQRTFGRDIVFEVHGSPAHRFALPEAESIPTALTINELLTNAVKHSTPGPIICALRCDDAAVSIRISNPGHLAEGFSLAQVAPGVSGLGLVRALLPRRSATLTLDQEGDQVCAEVRLRPPGFTLLEPL